MGMDLVETRLVMMAGMMISMLKLVYVVDEVWNGLHLVLSRRMK
jgi:hypothetical protein